MSNEKIDALNTKLFLFSEKDKTEGLNNIFFNHFKLLSSNPNSFEAIKISFEELIKTVKTNLNSTNITLEKIKKSFYDIIRDQKTNCIKKKYFFLIVKIFILFKNEDGRKKTFLSFYGFFVHIPTVSK